MSPAAATATRPVPRPSRPASTPRGTSLRLVVARRSQAARAPFVIAVVLLLGAGLLGLLALNTVLAQDAFTLHTLQGNGHVLADREQALQRAVSDLQSPASLAARATALGMVPGGSPAFLRLRDGKVLGAPSAGRPPIVLLAAPGAGAAVSPVSQKGAAMGRTPKTSKAAATGGWTTVKTGTPRTR